MMENMRDYSDMVEITEVSDIQKLLYFLMKRFHEICEQHNLYYVIFGGTMLGAVRHQAMVPWDDDIDVCMPRGDYEKFLRIVNEKYTDNFIVKCYPQKGYVYNFAKFCLKDSLIVEKDLLPQVANLMLYVDVFPVDGYPPKETEKKHFDKLCFYKKSRCKSIYKIVPSKTWWKKPYAFFKYVKRLPYRLIGYKYFVKKEIEESKKYDFDACEYVSMQGAGWNQKGKLSKKCFLDRKLYQFGKLRVWGISDYDEHLTRLYGDYMTPPPKENQISNHSYKLYVKKEYLSYE